MADTTNKSEQEGTGKGGLVKAAQAGFGSNAIAWLAVGFAVVIAVVGWIMHDSQGTRVAELEKKLAAQNSAGADKLSAQVTALGKNVTTAAAGIKSVSGAVEKLRTQFRGLHGRVANAEQVAAATVTNMKPFAGEVRKLQADLKALRVRVAQAASASKTAAKKAEATIEDVRARLAKAEHAAAAATKQAAGAVNLANDVAKAKVEVNRVSQEIGKNVKRVDTLSEMAAGLSKKFEALTRQLDALKKKSEE